MDFLLVFILIAVVYLLAITYMHYCIMQTCNKAETIPDNKHVVGIVYDTRPANLINRDLK